MVRTDRNHKRRQNIQSDQTSLSLGVGRATAADNQVLEALSSGTNQCTMEPVLNREGVGDLLLNLVGDSENSSFSFRDCVLRAANNNSGDVRVVIRLVDINLRASVVFDLVNGRAATAENASNRSGGNGELDLVVGLLLVLVGLMRRSIHTPYARRSGHTSRSSALACATPLRGPLTITSSGLGTSLRPSTAS